MPSNEIPIQAAREKYVETGRMDLAIEAYEAAKAAEQPCAGINKAALDQASAARKQYRADTPVSLQSIEGEDAVFVAAYLEDVKGDEQPLNAKEWGLGRGQAVITATLNAPREQPSQQPVQARESYDGWLLHTELLVSNREREFGKRAWDAALHSTERV